MKSRSKKQNSSFRAAQHHRNRLQLLEKLEDRRLLAGDLVIIDDYVDGTVLVQFTADATAEDKQAVVQQAGATVTSTFKHLNGMVLSVPTSTNEPALVASLNDLPQVKVAGLNRIYEPRQTIPNDPLFPQQWALNNTGQDPPGGTPDADIDAPEAWDIFQGSTETVVAVIDSGVDFTHPDLTPNLWVNPFEIPGNGIDDDGNGYVDDYYGVDTNGLSGNPFDTDGHGTSVAGVIAAAGNNGIGITGATWNTKVMSIKVGNGAYPTAAIVLGLDYIIDMRMRGVNVVASNNSYGGNPGIADPILYAAVNESINAGVVFVAAAGNTTNNNDIIFDEPSGYDFDGVISVAATTKDDEIADFSSFGKVTVDLGAPGEEILTTIPLNNTPTTPGFPLGYDSVDGTSFAAPYVTAAVALAAGLNPSLTVPELKAVILDTVDLLTDLTDTTVSGGRLNIGRMLDELPSGQISGQVFQDSNSNGLRDGNEIGLGGFRVFTDLNSNGTYETTEPFTFSAFDGTYQLPHYAGPGVFDIVVEPQPGTDFTQPSDGQQTVTISSFVDTVSGVNFGINANEGGISGTVFQDDGDPTRIDQGVAGVYVYVDLNQNGRADLSEPFDITDANGDYTIATPGPGNFLINVQVPPGWSVLNPVGGHDIDVEIGQSIGNLDFLLSGQLFSFGTAPTTYGEPHAGILNGFQLGPKLVGAATKSVADPTSADGIDFSAALTEGSSIVITAEVNTGGQPRGYLNGWIDFDRDGTFSASEQILTNERLGTGVHTLASFTVPLGVGTGDTWARFRYGWEYDVTATQAAFAGEVEDFLVTIFGNEPVAIDDTFTGIDQNSSFAANQFDVLANDVVSAAGGALFISDFDASTSEDGSVRQVGSQLQYMPKFGFFGTDSFTYTVEDSLGATSTATVTLFVDPDFNGPVAIDDLYYVNANLVGQPQQSNNLRVTLNDIPSQEPGATTLLNRVTVAASHGTAVVFDNQTADPLDDVIQYTPTQGFQGTDQFSYELRDSNGLVSEATVTVQVGDTAVIDADDIVHYTIGFSLPDGTAISSVPEGTPFFMDVYVRDLREDPVFPPPPATPVDRRGVFAAYVDVQFDRNLLTVTGEPTRVGAGPVPSSPFLSRQDGSTFIPGLVDELGGITPTDLNDSPSPTGTDPLLIARIPVVAQPGASGSNVTVRTDPADLLGVDAPGGSEVSGIHDTLIFEPSTDVEVNEMRLGSSQITITSGAAGEPGSHNRFTPTDVNNDRITNILDLRDTFVSLLNNSQAEGEAGSYNSKSIHLMVDVNNDGVHSPADLRLVFDALRSPRFSAPASVSVGEQPEGEAGSFVARSVYADAPQAIAADDAETVDLLLATQDSRPAVSDAAGAAQRQTDRLLADLDDDFFSAIGDIWK